MSDRILHKTEFGYLIWCEGCGCCHGIWTERPNEITGARWTFNGDEQRPTFSPSILLQQDASSPRCHSFVRDGRIEYLSDCTHTLAGQTVPLSPF